MGYSITIGNAVTRHDAAALYMRIDVEPQALGTAPVFGNDEMTGNGNGRHPSYSAWHDFCRDTGLEPLFYGSGWGESYGRYMYLDCPEDFHRETPLLRDHPGAQPINAEDVMFVQQCLADYRKRHPDAQPGFMGWDSRAEDEKPGDQVNANMARLIWLEFWMRWAVENCQYPCIGNS